MSSEINICSIFSGFVFDICFLRVFIKKNTHTLSTNTRNTEHAGFYVLFVSVSEFLVLYKKNGSRSNLRFFSSKVFWRK